MAVSTLGMLDALINMARTVALGERELYPAWQGMCNMSDGLAKLEPLDNDRHQEVRWTTAREVLSATAASRPRRARR